MISGDHQRQTCAWFKVTPSPRLTSRQFWYCLTVVNEKKKAPSTDNARHSCSPRRPCQPRIENQEQTNRRIWLPQQQSLVKVNFGALAADARGKIGGIVYSRNSSGAYARTKVSPVNVNTQSQKDVRSIFGTLSKQWGSALTDSQRQAWNLFATTWPRTDVFGNSVTISGQNMYVSLNAILIGAGAAQLTDPPADLAVTPVPIDPASLVSSIGSEFTFDQSALGTTTATDFYVFASRGMPAGRKVSQSDYRFIGAIPTAITGTVPISHDMSAQWEAVFPPPTTGQVINGLVATLDHTKGALTVGIPISAVVS